MKMDTRKKMIIIFAVVAMTVLVASTLSVTAYSRSKEPYAPDKAYSKIDMSVQGITAYKEQIESDNARLSAESIDSIITTITFSRPISMDELSNYVKMYDVNIVQITLRGMEPDGSRITVFSRTDKGFKETESMLFAQAKMNGCELIGVIAMNALVNSSRLDELQADSLTYLADTTGDKHYKGNRNIQSMGLNSQGEVSVGKSFPHSPYWDLEDLNVIDVTEYSKMDSSYSKDKF